MNNHTQFLSQKRFNSLDGLRAISIIAVIWHHTAPSWVNETLSTVGTQGVTLFFAISGFLITTLLLREFDRTGKIDLKAFYLRRSFRIFPIYYGVLIVYVLLVLLLEQDSVAGQDFFINLKYFATYTSNLFVPLTERTIFFFSWSLATEEQFYFIWPSILLFVGTLTRASIFLSVVSVACILDQLSGNHYLSVIQLAIVFGSLMAVTMHSKKGFNNIELVLGQSWSLPLITVTLAASLIASAPSYIVHALFTVMVGACVIRENHLAAPLLSWKPAAYIGSISYGMYMLHMLCKNTAIKLLGKFDLVFGGLEVFAITFILATISAGLSFKYYESFFLKLKKKYER